MDETRLQAEKNTAAWAAYRAREWRRVNPDAYKHLERLCVAEARAQRRVSIARAVEEVRAVDHTSIEGKPVKINNNMRAALARLIVKDHPEVAPFIEFRRAACDGLV